MYLFESGAVTYAMLPSAIVMLAASGTTLTAISLHNVMIHRLWHADRTKCVGRLGPCRPCTKPAFYLALLCWIAAAALNLTFTFLRQSFCSVKQAQAGELPMFDFGVPCYLQRSTIGAALLAVVISALFVILRLRVRITASCHLFGIARPPPAYLPTSRKQGDFDFEDPLNNKRLLSDMSFKCRSTSSLTLVNSTESSENDLYFLAPTRPEKAYGLGIWAPQHHDMAMTAPRPSFLAPRPSLKTISSYTAGIAKVPDPESPMPVLPAYFPGKVDDLVHEPRAALMKRGRESRKTIRRVPPSPILGFRGLTRCESLSSVYSRDVSGIRAPHPLPPRPNPLAEHISSFGCSGVKYSTQPLPTTSIAGSNIPRGPEPGPRTVSASSNTSTAIDDAATLQARLPRASSPSSMHTSVGPEERALNVLLHSQCGLRYGCLHRAATGRGDLNGTCRWTPMEVKKRSHCIMTGARQSVGIAV
nr:hypothetical protein B0A51_07757 [Rachicladosporium sp. CCFEE 5018]